MTDLFWPGDHLAGELMSGATFLASMVEVESAWLDVLVDAGVAPAAARVDLTSLMSSADVEEIAVGAAAHGNPVIELLAQLRRRAGGPAAHWLHRGLTSQDVLDSAMMLCLRDALTRVEVEIDAQVLTLSVLVKSHRHDPMLARTLAQPALPITVGLKLANWLSGVLDVADVQAALPVLPVQAGGGAGTLAALTELTGSPDEALALSDALADALALAHANPWHTTRSVVTRAGDALVTCCDAWGHIASDVVMGNRAEVGEMAEGQPGGSSTMPHKQNPVLSILIRRAALTAPHLAAALHTASASSVDERSDAGWHAEWSALRTLARHAVAAGAQTSELLSGLRIDRERASVNLTAAGDLLAEKRTMTDLTGRAPGFGYIGATDHLIETTLHRARDHLKETA